MLKIVLLLILLFPICINAQFYLKKDHLVYGINVGAYIANSNTAHIYRGDTTAYNVYSICHYEIGGRHTYYFYFAQPDIFTQMYPAILLMKKGGIVFFFQISIT